MIHRNISEIYNQYPIPANLQLHMVRTAAVGQFILDHWNKEHHPAVDRHLVITVLLLHDMGNIVKMDFAGPSLSFLVPADAEQVEIWKKAQQAFIAQYGLDDHAIPIKIAEELGFPESVLALLTQRSLFKSHLTVQSRDYALKIVSYADLRVGPYGVLSLEGRFADLKRRYAGKIDTSVNYPNVDLLISSIHVIEK